MTYDSKDFLPDTYDEIFCCHEIFKEPNPDHYRGGSVWSVSKDEFEIDCGLEPSPVEALAASRAAIEKHDVNAIAIVKTV